MPEDTSTRFYDSKQKPTLAGIQRHLQQRLIPNAPGEKGISRHYDSLGNRVFSSEQFHEIGLHGDRLPAEIVFTPEGERLVRTNSQLLREITSGTIQGECIGEGDEGKAYKVVLQTQDGPKPYVVKYTFPIRAVQPVTERVIHSFTPRVDDMRLMQWVQRNLPYEFHYVIPVIATNDMHVAPYLTNTISAELVQQILNKETSMDTVPNEFRQLFHKALSLDAHKRNASFSYAMSKELTRSLSHLSRDIQAAIAHKTLPPEFTAKGPVFEFAYRPDNVLISMGSFQTLLDSYERGLFEKPQEWEGENPHLSAFQRALQQSCWFIEMMINRDDVLKRK